MERANSNDCVELIDLGTASVATRGAGYDILDIVAMQPRLGLSDD